MKFASKGLIFIVGLAIESFGDSFTSPLWSMTQAGGGMAVMAEVGANGNYGVAGAEAAYLFKSRLDIHLGVGVSDSGLRTGAGLRLYTRKTECFFFKHCSDSDYISLTGSNKSATDVTSKNGSTSETYHVPAARFVNLAIGNLQTFFDHLMIGVNLGYKFALQRVEATQISGETNESSSHDINSDLKSGPQVSLSGGFLF